MITPGRTFERATDLGYQLGDAVLTALDGIATSRDLRLVWHVLPVDLPLKQYPPPNDAERALRQAEDRLSRLESDPQWPEYRHSDSEVLCRSNTRYYALEAVKVRDGRLPIRLQGLRIGGSVFVAVPAEVFVEIGLRVKHSAPHRTSIAGVANGSIGYLPSRSAYQSGGYEVVSSRCGPDAEDRLVEAVLELERVLAAR